MPTDLTTADRVELSIPCASDYVGVVRLAISGVATRMNFSVEDIEDIKIAVSEACTNAVQYAFDGEEKQSATIKIICNLHADKLEITVKDNGKGFDQAEVDRKKQQKSEGTAAVSEGEIPTLGLGLTFIQSLMDEAEITSVPGKGTSIRMVKHI